MIKEKLLKYCELKGITKTDFCKNTGVAIGFFTQGKGVGSDNLEAILDYYKDISSDWLLRNEGEMLRNGASEASSQKIPSEGIPLVEIEAVAGFGNADFAITEQDVKDYYIVPEFSLLHIDFMLKIRGSSMYPKYNSGDVVACTIIKERNFIQWNRCHIIATASQGILCKRLLPSERKGYIRAVSDNTSYPPFEIPEEDITGIALVVGVVRME